MRKLSSLEVVAGLSFSVGPNGALIVSCAGISRTVPRSEVAALIRWLRETYEPEHAEQLRRAARNAAEHKKGKELC